MVRDVTDDDTGMKVLHEAITDDEIERRDRAIDVVALHGLGAHPDDTWTKKRGEGSEARWVNWLEEEDMLPSAIPNTRIMRYGYKSNWSGPHAIKTTARAVALRFLRALQRERKNCEDRSLIFIAHSFGGLVLLKALCDAAEDRTQYPGILEAVRGLLFFGTPFRGADGMSQTEMVQAARQVHAAEDIQQEALHILDPGNELLQNLVETFQRMAWRDMPLAHITCFFELQASEIGAIVGQQRRKAFAVTEGSGTLDVSDRVSKYPLERNHCNMNKFARPTEEDYKIVVDAIEQMARRAYLYPPKAPGPSVVWIGSDPPQKQRFVKPVTNYSQQILNSLPFKNIENRCSNIKAAHSTTCRWLLTHPTYTCWTDRTTNPRYHRLLWLKGKPGTGKSTIMKYALAESKKSYRKDINLSFFFNARGSPLEKNTVGMYRSLLLQIFTEVPEALRVLDYFSVTELPQFPNYQWTVPQLTTVLDHTIQELEQRRIWLFVDALDECDEDEVRDMLTFLQFLEDQTISFGIDLRMFFASRHYPRISVRTKLELILENVPGHDEDIQRYTRTELAAQSDAHEATLNRIRTEIERRASGIFLWVVITVRILQKSYDAGRVAGLQQRLQEIPDDLDHLFQGILARDNQNIKEVQLCIQSILFAKIPLTREQLYFAVISGTDPEVLGRWDPKVITADIMDAFILSCSKGLAEVTQSMTPVVQFIHETVRDYLLKGNGMQYIRDPSKQSIEGFGHDSLTQCCANYIVSAEDGFLKHCPASGGRSYPPTRESMIEQYPFIEYAVRFILQHADVAHFHQYSKEYFLRNFRTRTWLHMANIVKVFERDYWAFRQDSTLLYILVEQNLKSLILLLLSINPQIDVVGGLLRLPIIAALNYRKHEALSALLTPGLSTANPSCAVPVTGTLTDQETQGLIYAYNHPMQRSSGASVLESIFRWGAETDALVLLRSGWFALNDIISAAMPDRPLSFAAARGYGKVVKYLLAQDGGDYDVRDAHGLTPLSKAAKEGHQHVVMLLLQGVPNINVNSQNSAGRSCLSLAVTTRNEELVRRFLLHPGVDVNLRDSHGRTPFFYAVQEGHKGIVELFLTHHGTDVVSQSSSGHTALSWAVLHEHTGIVEQLLKTGQVELNSQDHVHGWTALSMAFDRGYEAIAELLLKTPGIDTGIRCKQGRSLMDYAHRSGHGEMARRLLRWPPEEEAMEEAAMEEETMEEEAMEEEAMEEEAMEEDWMEEDWMEEESMEEESMEEEAMGDEAMEDFGLDFLFAGEGIPAV